MRIARMSLLVNISTQWTRCPSPIQTLVTHGLQTGLTKFHSTVGNVWNLNSVLLAQNVADAKTVLPRATTLETCLSVCMSDKYLRIVLPVWNVCEYCHTWWEILPGSSRRQMLPNSEEEHNRIKTTFNRKDRVSKSVVLFLFVRNHVLRQTACWDSAKVLSCLQLDGRSSRAAW